MWKIVKAIQSISCMERFLYKTPFDKEKVVFSTEDKTILKVCCVNNRILIMCLRKKCFYQSK